MALTPPATSKILDVNNAINGGQYGNRVVRCPNGNLFAIQQAATNPVWYSTDGGSTWANLAHTPLSWGTSNFTNLDVTGDNHVIVHFLNAVGSSVRLQSYDFSGSTPSAVDNISVNGGGGITWYLGGLAVFLHPDQVTYPGQYMVVCGEYNSSNGNVGYWTFRYNGSTFTQQVTRTTVITTSSTENSLVIHATTPNGSTPISDSTPVLSAFGETGASFKSRSMTWNGTNWTLGTERSRSMYGGIGYTGTGWDGSFAYFQHMTNSTTLQVWKMTDGSDPSPTLLNPPSPGLAVISFKTLFIKDDGVLVLLVVDWNVAGIRYVEYDGSWGAYSTILNSANQIDNPTDASPGAPRNGMAAVVFEDEAGATDEFMFALIFQGGVSNFGWGILPIGG